MKITPQEALTRVIEHREIFHDEMLYLMRQIMAGEVSPVMIAAIIIGLRVKKETIGEITAAAQVMRELSTKVDVPNELHLVDTCGTGGDSLHTFNVSTASAFVAAAAGAKVAKHGGRSVSSSCGSADVLEALGVNVHLTPIQVSDLIKQIGIGFMFAPNHHSAMKHAAPVRKELGVRTLFNILGPLTNPAGVQNQVLGVFHQDLVGILARVLQQLGSKQVLVVHGGDGLDEISISDESHVAELRNGEVSEYIIHPQQFGLQTASLGAIRVSNIAEAKAMLLGVLDNKPGAARDVVALNAGAAIYAAGITPSLGEGVKRAQEALASGAARKKLDQLVAASSQTVR
ncbi:MAG: anthranilate phosphoribosyltransferase [Burkholderiales bacterium]